MVYDFDIEVEWRGNYIIQNYKGENESDNAEGTYKIKDLNSLDNDFELIHINSR